MKTRIFTRDELDGIGVPFECDPKNGYAEELHDELWDTTRWAHVFEFVFRAPDDGKAYRVYYWTGATEMQDQDLWDWDDEITAIEVEQVQVTKTEWKPVKEES
ncbi:hypothetical protein SEA_IBANTIK_31 [Streptomyces phage Ibantik]|uniref:Uncharacterized protein n=1 Tax=Streptomyces phage Ibantik TaxID=2182397 RepID=A0A2U8UNK7_9CAUD|nr:hypothetical protein QEH36_gp031 [Streptomyces phage Ibantik]AWN05255.1 hypothetical protein SEA_IBANTIK_31 [Streptomyces phage Ibantik]